MLKITVPDFSVQTTLSERDLKPWALELTAFIIYGCFCSAAVNGGIEAKMPVYS